MHHNLKRQENWKEFHLLLSTIFLGKIKFSLAFSSTCYIIDAIVFIYTTACKLLLLHIVKYLLKHNYDNTHGLVEIFTWHVTYTIIVFLIYIWNWSSSTNICTKTSYDDIYFTLNLLHHDYYIINHIWRNISFCYEANPIIYQSIQELLANTLGLFTIRSTIEGKETRKRFV